MAQVQVELERPLKSKRRLLEPEDEVAHEEGLENKLSSVRSRKRLTQSCSSRIPNRKMTRNNAKNSTSTKTTNNKKKRKVKPQTPDPAAATAAASEPVSPPVANIIPNQIIFLTMLFFDLHFDLCIAPNLETQFVVNNPNAAISSLLSRMHTAMIKNHLLARMYFHLLTSNANNVEIHPQTLFQTYLQTMESQGIAFIP